MSDTVGLGLSRRQAIRLSLALGATSVLLPGCGAPTSSAGVFTDSEKQTLKTIGDALVPGADAAGIADFVSAMLADVDPMLCYRFVSFPMPPLDFYRKALSAIADLSVHLFGKAPGTLNAVQREALVTHMQSPNPRGWSGPPPALVYFVIRNDAADVVYGGEDAYARLDVPYMAHITPPGRW